jgi:hypothetical protein
VRNLLLEHHAGGSLARSQSSVMAMSSGVIECPTGKT